LWFVFALLLVYGGFGLASIAHQSWGAALSRAPAQRSRITAVREGCGLLGVIGVAGAIGQLSQDGLSLLFCLCLLACAAPLLWRAPIPAAAPLADALPARHSARGAMHQVLAPLRGQAGKPFRALFGILLVNGVATAIPATLFLFFADDRLKLGADAGYFLVLYFLAAAASMPLWVVLARRFGEARAWCAAMLLAALVFVWAGWLGAGPGALMGFGLICLLSGLALGADLALPPALLAGVIGAAGHGGRGEGAYFGLWNWGTQMTLALAAGIALPLLQWLGYVPGQAGVNGDGTMALALAYAVVPCLLKLLAAWLLWRAPLADL
jgi:Na+/melibiose symporter-like transporter